NAVGADLQEERAAPGELEDLRVRGVVAADPDVALVIHRDAVIARRPLVARTGSAPGADEVAGLIELQHRGRHAAADPDRWLHVGGFEIVLDGLRTMEHPDVILG